ncbi:hypothetical protein ABZ383_31085 [Streptomyces sp. NPDC005900]|uniref:hypothetical protein n=1 Tax=Streptomyces sp. NPDC005900 TaxID=3154569 RepID=UPI0033F72453
MDTAVRAWLLDQLGQSTNTADLDARYTRLGTARAVAISVIQSRLADLRAQAATVGVSGVVNVSFTENIKAYERQLTALIAGDEPAPDDPPGTGQDNDTIRLGLIQLTARPRR